MPCSKTQSFTSFRIVDILQESSNDDDVDDDRCSNALNSCSDYIKTSGITCFRRSNNNNNKHGQERSTCLRKFQGNYKHLIYQLKAEFQDHLLAFEHFN